MMSVTNPDNLNTFNQPGLMFSKANATLLVKYFSLISDSTYKLYQSLHPDTSMPSANYSKLASTYYSSGYHPA